MKNELISMVDFVLGRENWLDVYYYGEGVSILNYANFLNTPLNISMFVPAIKVGDKWEVLEEPICYGVGDEQYFGSRMDEYQTAQSNVIFEGFDVTVNVYGVWWVEDKKHCIKSDYKWKIQDLIKYKPTLTKKGLYVSGLNNK